MLRPSRADWMHASATTTVASPSRIVMMSCRTSEHCVAKGFVLDPKRLRLGDGESRAVALCYASEAGNLIPLSGNESVLVEGQVTVEGVGDERVLCSRSRPSNAP